MKPAWFGWLNRVEFHVKLEFHVHVRPKRRPAPVVLIVETEADVVDQYTEKRRRARGPEHYNLASLSGGL